MKTKTGIYNDSKYALHAQAFHYDITKHESDPRGNTCTLPVLCDNLQLSRKQEGKKRSVLSEERAGWCYYQSKALVFVALPIKTLIKKAGK